MIKLRDVLNECDECGRSGRDWNHGHDHEASMAKNEIRDMISNASKIDTMVGEEDNLPGWVSAYISLAADYMHSVAEYLGGESAQMQQEPAAPTPGYAMYEANKKPSAGLTNKQKSAVAKKAHAGKDIGKKGPGFEKVAKAAGGGEKGQKIAAAAMWKNVKR